MDTVTARNKSNTHVREKKAFQYIKQESNILNSESIDKFICTICNIIEHIESANITSTYPDVVI